MSSNAELSWHDQSRQPADLRDHSSNRSKTPHPAPETTSDNDVEEKPIREKLKKTSIASISQYAKSKEQTGSETQNDPTKVPSSFSPRQNLGDVEDRVEVDGLRGRPVRKRSFDDLEAIEPAEDGTEAMGHRHETFNGHARKRSRDVRTGELVKEEGRLRAVEDPLHEVVEDARSDTALQESSDSMSEKAVDAATEPLSRVEIESGTHNKGRNEAAQQENNGIIADSTAEADTEFMDHEMRDSTASPRKKRSRDQLDSEAEREQKIPATEEARAQRTSDEIDRNQYSHKGDDKNMLSDEISIKEPAGAATDIPENADDMTKQETKSNKTFGATSTLSTTDASKRQTAPVSKDGSKGGNSGIKAHDSNAAFASSGFAALAQSSTSPFGAVGATSRNENISPFGSSSAFGPKKSNPMEGASPNTKPAASTGFNAFAGSTPSFGGAQRSSFAMTGATSSGVFGGSVFGGSFGGALGGGNKLSNFASPIGSAKIGTGNGSIQAIGSPVRTQDEDEEEQSDSDGGNIHERERSIGGDEVDSRFQRQDGKDLFPWIDSTDIS